MILTLEATGPEGAKLGTTRRKQFSTAGGTIGSLPNNDWCLPDRHISRRHAVISHRDGVFYIEDTSSNGVFLNAPEHRIPKGRPHPLSSNDLIFIEPFEIHVRIEVPSQARRDDPLADILGGAGVSSGLTSPGLEVLPGVGSHMDAGEVDPLKLLDLSPTSSPVEPSPRVSDLQAGPRASEHFAPPPVRQQPPPPRPTAAAGVIPTGYDPFSDNVPEPPSPAFDPGPGPSPIQTFPPVHEASRRVPPVQSAPSHSVRAPQAALDLGEVLRGAGLDPSAVTPELASDFGQILRIVVEGVMDVLQARQRLKSEFRMGMTTFRPAGNNPLKFSANVDDALHNLLVKRNPAYLGPVDAFKDAFDDVRNHQMAVLAGMRVAFETMLGQFDPSTLQQEFDRQLKKGALMSVPARLRYWDLYTEKIRDMVRDPESSFRELFGDEFASAYEEQLERLKARERGASS